ncbi:glycosyltransferase [Gordonia sp. PKS22-38]|uniref:Glycosyltransferase n=1 Tax=Gordonia prachuapensis TaxID=3115651 RepID=A0ABU7MYJ7_9ACTN|nr:glycosyltransferase [Gordonia sp. PKS22-38]
MESGAIYNDDITVIICAYTHRRWNDLCSSITSVVTQLPPPFEVVVVIDHNDELVDDVEAFVARTAPTVPVRVLRNRGPQGLSGARNTGVAAAGTAVVAFLDDDATADAGWVGRMAAGYTDARVRGVGGYARARWPGGRRPGWFPAEFDWVVGCSYPGQPIVTEAVRNFIGANMSLRRDDITAVGGFHTGLGRVGRIPLGCEETEMCIRIAQQRSGVRMMFDPAMAVAHRVTDDRVTPRYFFRRCYAEGVSKAAVSGLVGAADGLASERTYTAAVLPYGILTRVGGVIGGVSVAGGVAHGARSRMDLATQAATIVAGAVVTVAGYARGRLGGAAVPTRDGSLIPAAEPEPTQRRSGA